MPRTAKEDPLQGFRFTVSADAAVDLISFTDPGGGEAGFNAVTTPEQTSETVEYREGTSVYTRKFPGIPTMNTLTLSRGVYLQDTGFHDWIKAAAGGGEYRTHLTITHWHRTGRAEADSELSEAGANARNYLIYEALPSRSKPAADLDATTGEISLAELDVDFENFDIVPPS